MITEQIAALAVSGESEMSEFKATAGTRRKANNMVRALLNQRSGQELFGATQDGIVVGQQVSGRTVKELSAELQQINPLAFPTVERVSIDGGREVVVVNTSQGTSRPYTYCLGLHRVPGGRYWGIITGGTIGGAMCPIYLGLTMTKRRGGIVSGHD